MRRVVNHEVQHWWIDTIGKVIEKPEWKKYLKENDLNEKVLWDEECVKYLENHKPS